MNRRSAMIAAFLCVGYCGFGLADEPLPPKASITVAEGVKGAGTRAAPYTFDATTKCVLILPEKLEALEWDLQDGPAGSLIISHAVVFDLKVPGEYLVTASWTGGKSRAWLVIRRSSDVPDTGTSPLSKRLKTTLVGPDAKTDAAKFSAICKGAADSFDERPPATWGALVSAWKAAVDAAEWPGGKYSDIPAITRAVMPPNDAAKQVTGAELTKIISDLRDLSVTAQQIAEVK